MARESVTIRALLIEKEDGWIAQCLDYDIVAQAGSLAELSKELDRVLVSHIAISLEMGRQPFAGFGRAPQRYWDLYERTTLSLEDLDLDAQEHPETHVVSQLRVTNARELEYA